MKIQALYDKYRDKYIHLFGRSFYGDIVMITMITIYVLIVVTILLILIFRVKAESGVIPLSYNVIYGVTSLGGWLNMYLYLIGYTVLGALNLLGAWAFFEKERLISYLMGLTNIVVGALFIIIIFNLTALVVR